MRSYKYYITLLLIVFMLVQLGTPIVAININNGYEVNSNLSVDNDNLPPVTDFSFTKHQKMDIVIVLSSGTYAASTVKSKLDKVVAPALSDKDIEANFNIISSNNALDAILPVLSWGESSERYYISINNGMFPELSNASKMANITGILAKDDICFIGMGNSGNQTSIEKLIRNNFSKGFYISNSNLDTALTKLANYLSNNVAVDLYFNMGISSSVTRDMLSNKIEAILKPKMVANNIDTNITINNGYYDTITGAKIAGARDNAKGIAVKPDGSVWTVGDCVRVPGEKGVGYLKGVDVAAYTYGYLVAGADGYVYGWGYNYGVLGLGRNMTDRRFTYPTKVLGGDSGDTYLSNIVAVASQSANAIALKSDGTVYQWGQFAYYSESGSTYENKWVPEKVKGPGGAGYLQNIVKIAASGYGLFAIDASGNLYGWGVNSDGPGYEWCGLGLGASARSEKYPRLLATNVKDISASSGLVAYLKNDGTVWDFGPLYHSTQYVSAYDSYIRDTPHRVYNNTAGTVTSICAAPSAVFGVKFDGTILRFDYYNSYADSEYVELRYYSKVTDVNRMFAFDNGVTSVGYYLKNDGTIIENERSSHYNMPLNMKTSIAYPYDEMLYSAPFRGEADQYFIELSDSALPELDDPSVLSRITGYLSDNNVRLFGFGSAVNKTQLENLLSLNDNKGAYYDLSNLDAAMSNLADYITSNAMKPPRLVNDYFLVTDTLDTPTTFYSDIESDPYDSRWVYEHNPNNFFTNTGSTLPYDNSAGYFSLDRKTLSQPVTSFIETDSKGGRAGKVGGYRVKLQVRDKPKGEDSRFVNYNRDSNAVIRYINLHRKPVACFTVSVADLGTKYNIRLSDSAYSYDPDHTSNADKGIARRLWGIATVTADGSVTWKYSKSTDSSITYTVPKGNNYLLSLEVQDIDGTHGLGAWSDPVIVGFPGKPVALFTISPNPLPVTRTATVTDMSYVTVPGYTITQRRWNIKKVGSASFLYANQPLCKKDYSDSGVGEYRITLEVQDSSGAWSLPFTQVLYVLDTAAPVIKAVPASRTWANTDATVTLSSHDDGGSGLKRLDYIWTKDTADISGYSSANISGNDHNFATSQSANGKWYLCARVADNSDNYSNNGNFSTFGTYNIDKLAPTVSAALTPGTYQTSLSTVISAADTGGSGIRSIQYKWTNTAAKPVSGWTAVNIASAGDNNENVSSAIDMEGTWYLHMQVTDYAGNTAYKYGGPLTIQYLSIDDVTIEGYWNHWRGQVDILGKRMSNEPHRFLSLECVKINISTSGDPDRVTVRFSPELEAMGYTDPGGHNYSYSEYFGHDISFPTDSTFIMSGNHIYWEYNLPLAPSSKDWNDNRLRPQYSMTVTAYKGGRSVTRTINDIDITGNIYDLTYIQPSD